MIKMNTSIKKCVLCNNEQIGEFITINDEKYHLCCIENLQKQNKRNEKEVQTMNYKDRLLVEYRELIERRIILQRALDDCSKVASDQVELLKKQLDYMLGYENILFVRIIDLMN